MNPATTTRPAPWLLAHSPALINGLIAVLISYAGPLVIVLQAAQAANMSSAQTASWIWAISIGSGLSGLLLSWRYRMPVITAWSTPGAALLLVSLPGLPFAEAVGGFILANLLIAALAFTGLFVRLMQWLPKPLAAAMLAGILLRFGLNLFTVMQSQPGLVLLMFFSYVLARRLQPRYAVAWVLAVGLAFCALSGQLQLGQLALQLAAPQWTTPSFSLNALLNLGLPLALVTLSGQHVPGLAVLRNDGYAPPATALVGGTALISVLLAPFGAHAINPAAITAAICTGPQTHADPGRRFIAGLACGGGYCLIGSFGATLALLFAALPPALIAALAGLALLAAIAGGLSGAMVEPAQREAALVTLLATASGVSMLGLSAAFWGLAFGLLTHAVMSWRSPSAGLQSSKSANPLKA
ncbi:benzoate/H(+) symporter BenE family transporter [Roseateles oligotrophus]|uniref:Benzoate/H(+) symporter BenE family transporter n=1 Tax=Roseateles oligotrophus TaxID=1769250 RepID=A0ABT2YEI9_9BURK|nr:benzoate/H(+) symporter BenE family transporter [Roseateles oligotrophus]MCV2368443.1 benzoate/H(+) symporter BenE family transporter [Roseateles oligotrophus]